MAGEAKDYVKNIEKKDNLKQELRDRIDNDDFVKKLDNDVEKSFQQFMESVKTNLSKDATKEELQDRFNGWLDRQMNVLDSFKNDEIAKAVIGPTTFELQNFSTAIELGVFQAELTAQKDSTVQTETVSVNGSDLKIQTYNDDAGVKVEKNKIAELFNENFEKKDKLLDLLKAGGVDNVKQFQRIIVGIENYRDGSHDSEYKGTTSKLGIYGVDGKFGGKTFTAFQNYIETHKIASTSGSGSPESTSVVGTPNNPTQTSRTGEVAPGTTGGQAMTNNPTQTTRTGEVTPGTAGSSVAGGGAGTNSPRESASVASGNGGSAGEAPRNNPSAAPEILDSSHNIKKLYEGVGGKSIPIATGFPGYEVNIIPTVLEGEFTFDIDRNGNVRCILPNDNWEGTVSLSFTKEGEEEKGPYPITIKAIETQESRNLEGLDKLIDEISKLDFRKDAYKQNLEIIPGYINKLRNEYAEILPKSSNGSENNGEELQLSDEANTKLQKIKRAMHKLLKAYKTNTLERTLRQIKSGSKGITTEKGNLNRDIIDGAIIYIDGKFLSKKEFLEGTDNSRKKYISKVNWHDCDVNIPADRDDFWYDNTESTLKNIEFSNLVLSDDVFSEKGNMAGNQEIQYDTYGYASGLETQPFTGGARKAIWRIIKGVDGLSIDNPDYAKTGIENKNLRHLRRGLNTLVQRDKHTESDNLDESELNPNDEEKNTKIIFRVFNFIAKNCAEHPKWGKDQWRESIKAEFSDISKDAIKVGHIADLGMLYNAYKNDQDGQGTGDYFKKVMGLLENYFVRGVDGVDSIEGMFDRELLGTRKDMIDPDNKKLAIRKLFNTPKKGEESNLLGVAFDRKTDQNKFNKLKDAVLHMDITGFFEKWGVGSNPVDLNKYEKIFYEEYKKYKEYLQDGNLDENGKPNLSENTYYNAVFHFLVGIGEARTDVVKAVNSLKLYDSEKITDSIAKESGFDSPEEMKLICLLTDFDFNGRVDLNDNNHNNTMTGVAIKTIYKNAKVDKKYEFIKKEPLQNFIEYATEYAKNRSDLNYQKLQKITEKIKDAKSEQEIYTTLFNELQKDPTILSFLQTIFETPTYGGVGNIFKYGGPEKTSQDLLDNENTPLDTREDAELSATEKAIKQIMDSEKFTETFEREYQKLVEQGLEDTPATKAKFKPIIAAGVLGNFMEGNNGTQFDNHNVGLSLGGTRETKAGDFTLMMGVGATIDGGVDRNSVGLAISRGKSWPVGKKGNTRIHTRAGAGATTDVGNRSNVSVLASTGFDISTCVNKKRLENTLKARPEAYFHTGGSVGAGYSIKENSWGLYVEGHVGYHIEEQQGIEDQYNLIKNDLAGKNGLIMSMLSEKAIWEGHEYDRKEVIRSKLEKKYFNKKKLTEAEEQQLNHAADSIYGWLAHYMVGISAKDVDDNTKLRIANDLAEVYATAWRNEAMSDLSGKTHLTGMQFSVMYVLGMIFPIATIGVDITSYKGLFTSETKESKARYQQELQTGARAEAKWGADFYDESDPENIRLKCVENEKGEKHYPALDYINEKLQVANQSVKLPKIKATTTPSSLDTGKYTPEKVTVIIPKDLYKYINVNIKSKLENSVQKDAKGDLLVPGNTIYHLLTNAGVSTGKFNLIIGGTTAESTDILLTPDETLYGTPTEYAGEKSEYTLDTKVLNDELTNFVKKSEDTADPEYNKYKDFPIEKCTGTTNKNGETFALLQLRNGVNPQNVEDMGGSNSKVEIQNNIVYTPQTGTLTVYKDMEGKYHLYYTSKPNYDFKINYEQEGWTETVTTNPAEVETHEYPLPFNSETDIFDVDSIDLDIFAGIEQTLSKADDKQWGKYVDFMNKACNITSGNIIDQDDYNKAFDQLMKMIDSSDIPAVKNIKSKFNKQFSEKEKVMIVDRFKTLFSYLPNLTDGKNDYKNISSTINGRGEKYKTLDGYDKDSKYPLTAMDYRAAALKKLEGQNNVSRVPIKNLFGMTAFYKIGWTDSTHTQKVKKQLDDGYGYSMTQMGHTNVLGGESAMVDIDPSEKGVAQEWFLKNLDKCDVHKNFLLNMLNNYVNQLLEKAGISHSDNIMNGENLFKLLKGEEIELKSIDNGQQNDIIKLSGDLRYVFYLLGECGNESVGVQLNGLKIETETTKITTNIDSVSNNSTVHMESTLKRTGGMRVSTSDHESRTQVNIAKESHFRVAMGVGATKTTGPQTEGGVHDSEVLTGTGVNEEGREFGDAEGNVNGTTGIVNSGKRPRGSYPTSSGSRTADVGNGQNWNPDAVQGAANLGEGYITNNRGKRKN